MPGDPLTSSHVVGLLRSQDPSSGLHRKKRCCRCWPSGVMVAIVPDFDQATALEALSTAPQVINPERERLVMRPVRERQPDAVSKQIVHIV
ncbi:hypothetical protein Trco_001992 [Trichoderma cornu-damae]|uniref:Uncharacterized protein n=1 Tax=Trichoderma cornu-damae TaxID=654480 RepID=A0A9P8TUL8_9HYPO|nr:hypothetical protein Trco_001992 [Trichoderma cornu-damae]